MFIHINHGPPKPTGLEVCMANNLVFRWAKTFILHGFGGSWNPKPDSFGMISWKNPGAESELLESSISTAK